MGPASTAAAPQPTLSVLQLITTNSYAGLERHVVQLAAQLTTRGALVTVGCPPSAHRVRAVCADLGIEVLPRLSSEGAALLRDSFMYLQARRVDIVHAHDGRSMVVGTALAGATGSALVRTQHFVAPASVHRHGSARQVSLAMHRLLGRRLDGYVGVSDAALRAARDRRDLGEATTVVIPPGVVLASEPAWTAAREARRGRSALTVAYVGRLEAEKELETLIRAIPTVSNEFPTTRFVIAGSGGHEKQLRAIADHAGADAHIEWKGWVDDPQAIMGDCDIYVNTWPWEGFGMAMAEAMSLGVPVVATDSGASPEVVEHGVTGYLYPPGDSEELARALLVLLADVAMRERLGHAARERALAAYGAGDTADATLALYRSLTATGNHPPTRS